MARNRIIVVDVLRGFALLMIVLIHYVEHFELFWQPEVNFLFSKEFDQALTHVSFLLVSGKAYSIFAVLFGLSFFIQMDNKARKGIDYRWGFMWRMTVLLIIGFIHSLVYRGDILHIYALLSLPIIFLFEVKTKYLWIIAGLLAMQIPLIYYLVQAFTNPDYVYASPIPAYWREGSMAYGGGRFSEVVAYNLWKGRVSVWSWSYDNGRIFQLVALFIVGLILGRKRAFVNLAQNRKKLVYIVVASIILTLVLSGVNRTLKSNELTQVQAKLLHALLISYINLGVTAGIIALVSLIYLNVQNFYFFRLLAAYGKMSLSNYIIQAVTGVVFFYGFGLAMYRYFGAAWSILLGALFFFLQAFVSEKWTQHFRYGPIEWFWRCCTNWDFSIKMKL